MKRILVLLATIAAAVLLAGGVAAAATFENSSKITINDAPAAGGPGVATPYPSTIVVGGLSTTPGIVDVNLALKGFSHTYPGDVDVLLVGPQGQTAYVMGDSGGGHPGVNNIDITLDDEAATPIPDGVTAPLTTGTYKPTPGIVSSGDGNFPADAPAKPYGTQLSVFDGTDPNGTWSLYVIDGAFQDSGEITNGWSLDITPDSTGPTVTSTDPSAKARGVDPAANVTATFSEDLLNTSIDEQSFQLFQKGSTTPLGAAVTYDAATDVATLDPTVGALQSGTTYKAVVSTEVRDLSGNQLDQKPRRSGLQPKEWSFTVTR